MPSCSSRPSVGRAAWDWAAKEIRRTPRPLCQLRRSGRSGRRPILLVRPHRAARSANHRACAGYDGDRDIHHPPCHQACVAAGLDVAVRRGGQAGRRNATQSRHTRPLCHITIQFLTFLPRARDVDYEIVFSPLFPDILQEPHSHQKSQDHSALPSRPIVARIAARRSASAFVLPAKAVRSPEASNQARLLGNGSSGSSQPPVTNGSSALASCLLPISATATTGLDAAGHIARSNAVARPGQQPAPDLACQRQSHAWGAL